MLDYLRIMLNARLAKMDERGASAVEYGLLIAGIAALIVVVVFLLGDTLERRLPEHQRLDPAPADLTSLSSESRSWPWSWRSPGPRPRPHQEPDDARHSPLLQGLLLRVTTLAQPAAAGTSAAPPPSSTAC